ncbi:CBP1 [Candida theae]|uniref:CBP1 n=1 Tax=Candida theae TaxID=1198502 RepID=A0AAD5G0U6_9ASCO|nr:CBP1 [Candida theae]KAI5967226.1 CBP1 [Candida theae]
MDRSVKVAIIGAGVSGLKAAETLLSSGTISKDDIVVLEAQDHFGGRIQNSDVSQSKLGIPYALGALWFHDSLVNSVLHELLDSGLLNDEDIYYDDKDGPTYSSEGLLDVSGLKLNRVMEEASQFFELYFKDRCSDASCDEVVKEYVKRHSRFLTIEQQQYIGRLMRYYELWYGVPAEKASGREIIDGHMGRNLLNKKSYCFLLDLLKKKVPDSCIALNQAVKSVTQLSESEKKIELETKTGLKVKADFVIVTVPLSILKLKGSEEFGINWSPPLPRSTQDFINGLDFAALGKVVLEFDNVWWDINEDHFLIIPDEIDSNDRFRADGTPKPFAFPALAVNYSKIYKKGGSLVILTPAPLTNFLELNPDQSWKYFKPVLEKIAVEPIEDPINTITSNWTQNPYIRGSYSVSLAKRGNEDNHKNVLEELRIGNDVIRFAGEHTIVEGAGCVHGAYDSGIREATYVLNAMKS